jgi:8-oxo-dGTP pyrophosphatase MutT (NUDIX family)
MESAKDKLKRVLTEREKLHIHNAALKPSAVLVPVFIRQDEYHILFTRRTNRVKAHKGQISFPGGSCEECDETHCDTARRESLEEIGLHPEDIEILGELDDAPTIGSDFVIFPFVGFIPCPYDFKPDPYEVAELIEVPIKALLDKSCVSQENDIVRGQPIKGYSYTYNGEIIWGATSRILHQFLEIWAEII